jgi:hypothetical protein
MQLRRIEFMLKGNACGMAILRRFLPDEIVDIHIRPLLVDKFPFVSFRNGRVTLHLHMTTGFWGCAEKPSVFEEIGKYYNRAQVAPTVVDVFIYHYRTDTHDRLIGCYDYDDQRLIEGTICGQPRVHTIKRTHIYPLPQ